LKIKTHCRNFAKQRQQSKEKLNNTTKVHLNYLMLLLLLSCLQQ